MSSFTSIIDTFEEHFFKRLERESNSGLFDCMYYAVAGGGKRVRPLLAGLVAEAVGGSIADVMPIAIAIELIHSYSLVHDDLPSMDNDQIRRGKPTVHVKYGEGMAVLCGDALLNLAYEVLSEGLQGRGEGYCKAVAEIARCAGIRGMVGGQYTDISGKKLNEAEFIQLYSQKTSALIVGAAVSASYALDASDECIASIRAYAYNLGIAFQIRDDIIEIEEKKDIDEENYVKAVGLERAREACDEYTKKSIDALKSVNNNQNLIKLAHLLLTRPR